MAKKSMGLVARLAGAVLGAGTTWVALLVAPWDPPVALAVGASAAMGLLGLLFGPAIVRAAIELA